MNVVKLYLTGCLEKRIGKEIMKKVGLKSASQRWTAGCKVDRAGRPIRARGRSIPLRSGQCPGFCQALVLHVSQVSALPNLTKCYNLPVPDATRVTLQRDRLVFSGRQSSNHRSGDLGGVGAAAAVDTDGAPRPRLSIDTRS
jgi:hypothetical protein